MIRLQFGTVLVQSTPTPKRGTPLIYLFRSISNLSENKRKHFREELSTGKIQANAKAAGALYPLALDGNVKAQTFWLKTVGGWQETGKVEVASENKLIASNRGQRVYSILFERFGEERVDI